MLSVKNELLATLATALDAISPGAGAKAAFESPKVAAHGDFACTAAMQLAKPLKLNPRALGEQLKATLEATPAYQRWVDAIEIAGPGFLNIRLKPAAKQEVVREVLAAGDRFGYQPGDYPVTEDLGERGLALPFFGQMSEEQVERVCRTLQAEL